MPARASADRLLVAESLGCTVDGRRLFSDVSLVVSAGDLLEVRGPNGSGKSTLLRGLAGLRAFNTGRVEIRGRTAYIGHKSGMSERLTPLENMGWLLRLQGLHPRSAELDDAFSRVGLGAARFEPCGTLSAGQLRRAAFARLLLCDADVWLLDEPMTAMDSAGTALVQGMIAEHRAAGGAAVCATHRALEAADSGTAHMVSLEPPCQL